MAFEIEVISRGVITPSSPTPDHLNKHKLSYIDQINPPILLPLVLFYPDSNSERLNQLKNSLSQALTQFYPLAGRLDNNSYINCNDEGVVFIESQANCKLLDVVNDPIPSEFSKFVPLDFNDSKKDICMIVQSTCFNCGGLAVGVGISHKLVDGGSFFMFLKSWAAISRGDDAHIISPVFNSATLFPPRDLGGFNMSSGMVKNEVIVTKRFLFTAPNIAALKQKYTKDGGVIQSPSRIEALSAFIWTRFMVSTEAKNDRSKIYSIVNAVNLRTRADPPFPDCYFGNFYWPVIAVPPIGDNNDKESSVAIAEKMRESIRAIDADYVNKLREGNGQLNMIKDKAKHVLKGEMVTFRFTSLCRFPLYEADFGWGKPMWVGTGSLAFKNLVTFLDSLSGDGIEAWINLKFEDMARFEADEELLSYVSSRGHDASSSTI